MRYKLLLLLGMLSAMALKASCAVEIIIGATKADSISYYLAMGRSEEAARKYGTAWQYYEKAAVLDGCDADIQLAIAEVCQKMHRMAPAIRALDSAAKLRSGDYALRWKLVQLYFYYDQSAKVVELLPELHSRYADTKGWAYMLGRSYEALQDFGKAISYLAISIKEDSTNAEAFYRIGRMYMLMENYRKSIPYYKHYLAMDTGASPTRTYELALVLSNAEQFDSSLAYFQKALDRGYKARDDFYMNMAYTMADAHQSSKAIAMLQDMLQRRPGDLGLMNGLAQICFEDKRFDQAIKYWEQVMAIDKSPYTLYAIGRAYIKVGDEKRGKAMCEKAISMDPSLGVLRHVRQMSPM